MANGASSAEQIDALVASVNDASALCRTTFLTFMLIALYFMIIVWSTTDEQLLRADTITLPLLGVELPIVGFYIIAPALFVLFHFHLLVQYQLLEKKMVQLLNLVDEVSADKATVFRRLSIFAFTQWRKNSPRTDDQTPGDATESAKVRWLVAAVVWISSVAVPIFTLLWAQVRFLPYHSDAITLWHQFVFTADLALIAWIWLHCRRPVFNLAAAIMGALLFIFCWTEAVVPIGAETDDLVKDKGPNLLDMATGNDPAANRIRYLYVPETNLVAKNIPNEVLAALVARNSDVREIADTRYEHIQGLDLRGRDLRGANLNGSGLVNADLRGAVLDDAYLIGADLSGADLRPNKVVPDDRRTWEITSLARAQLKETALERVKLFSTNFRDAVFDGARLRPIEPAASNFAGAKFSQADLRGALLSGSLFTLAKFEFTSLQGADLQNASFLLSRFSNSWLSGANLAQSSLFGSSWTSSFMDGAHLRDTDLRASRFHEVYLSAAYLSGAKISGVNWTEVVADFVDFRKTETESREASFKDTLDRWSKSKKIIVIKSAKRLRRAIDRVRDGKTSITLERVDQTIFPEREPFARYHGVPMSLQKHFDARAKVFTRQACRDPFFAQGLFRFSPMGLEFLRAKGDDRESLDIWWQVRAGDRIGQVAQEFLNQHDCPARKEIDGLTRMNIEKVARRYVEEDG